MTALPCLARGASVSVLASLLAAPPLAALPLAALPLARAQTPVGPAPAIAAARAAAADTARGNHIRVTLLTVGPGDEVFERFGHNLLWIRNNQ
jgi:hypothetical protein